MHSKIASGSSLIQIDCSSSQGRFLKVGFVCILHALCKYDTKLLPGTYHYFYLFFSKNGYKKFSQIILYF